jgi:hypothetical protein
MPPSLKWGIENEKILRESFLKKLSDKGHYSPFKYSGCGFFISKEYILLLVQAPHSKKWSIVEAIHLFV